ncbi:MAG: 4'-phosphopantetheinyl transferase superfamily protein [Bacteroidota bacterium]
MKFQQVHINRKTKWPLHEQEVHIFFSLLPEKIIEKKYLAYLDNSEKRRLEAYKTPGKRSEFLYGRYLMKHLISKYLQLPIEDIQLRIDSFKRPYLSKDELQFNLSHSFGGFAFILSKSFKVGIDVEYKKRKLSLEDGKHVFMKGEKASLGEKGPRAAKTEFLKRWTLKEAIYKAAEQGPKLLFNRFEISFNPLRLRSHSKYLSSSGWDLGQISPHIDYQLAFAIDNPEELEINYTYYQIL